jgi:hypothetical protein
MGYVSKWESLSAACERMTAAGLAKDEAKNDIGQMVADGVVEIRVTLRKHATNGMRSSDVLQGKHLEIPTAIKPEDLDWNQSRPVNPWFVKRGAYSPHGFWHIETIELCRSDVTNALCTAARPGGPVAHAESEAGTASRSGPVLENNGVGLDPVCSTRRIPGAPGSARRRGARPQKFEQTCSAMRDDLGQGRRTPGELKNMLEKNLADTYSVSRDTARKARNAVLAELGEIEFSTNSDNDK